MIFKDRQGRFLNRKKLKVISQTPTEMIVDVERFDEPTEEGTKINASVFNTFQEEINTSTANANRALTESQNAKNKSEQALTNSQNAISTANSAELKAAQSVATSNEAKSIAEEVRGELADRGATVYVGDVAKSSISFTSDPQTQLNNKLEKAKNTETTFSANDLLIVQKSDSSKNFNITLKTLTNAFLSAAFPVGAIYMSTSPTNPSSLFGGTWEAYAQGRTIFGAGTSDKAFSAGATGGESTHLLSVNEMPSHTHTQKAHGHAGINKDFNYWFSQFTHSGMLYDAHFHNVWQNSENTNVTLSQEDVINTTNGIGAGKSWGYRKTRVTWNHTPEINNATAANNNTGGKDAHNNLPPYIVTYVWKRVS